MGKLPSVGESGNRGDLWGIRVDGMNKNMEPDQSPVAFDDASILKRYGIEPDPVIEAYKAHVDRTLLRQNLMRSPAERWENFVAVLRLADEFRRAGESVHGR